MIPFVALSIVFCVAIAIAVLWANFHRFTNQAFAGTFVLVAIWLGCVLLVMRCIAMGRDPTAWHRANTAVASFIPWAIWLLKESIVARHARVSLIVRKSLPWLMLGLFQASLCYTNFFIVSQLDRPPRHGIGYVVWEVVAISTYLLLTTESIRDMRRETGIRRVEMQFWTVNFGLQGGVITSLMAIGNMAHVLILKDIAIAMTFGMFAITAWAITAHRVFDVRQVFLSLAHRASVIVALCVGILSIASILGRFIPAYVSIVVAVAACSLCAIWLERVSRRWFRVDHERLLNEMRSRVIEIARTELHPAQLVRQFEHMLSQECKSHSAALLFDSAGAFVSDRYRFEKDDSVYAALSELNWVTPERLQRQPATPNLQLLQQYLSDHSIALLLTVPHGSPSPSLIVAIGTKINEWPFTYPEIVRIQNAAELIDNILTRSRLTSQAALRAKTEHLAMMSRGLAHDLKNLLTPVSSFLVHTEGRFPPDSAEAEVHGAAQRSVRMMGEYVREARFFAERLTPHFERVSLRTVSDGVLEVTQARATARHISIAVSAAGEGDGLIDRVLVQRLLANLVANAIDASSPGQTVALSGELRHGRIRFQVKDEGCGIPAENLGRIFEAYFTTKEFGEDVRGFGLGLTICQKIAALHGGDISVESKVGHGSVFTVDLPAAPPLATVNCVMLSSGAGI